METNLLLDELLCIQENYKKMLMTYSEKSLKYASEAIVDETNIFWMKNKKIVDCVLQYLYKPYSSYVFTATATLNVDINEHFPFITIGEYHFWDDPLYSFYPKKIQNTEFVNKFEKQVSLTIENNIKLINNAKGLIHILPVRFYTEKKQLESINKVADEIFLSMFKDDISMEDYGKQYKTIDDIQNGLKSGVESNILFSAYDDISLDFKKRFENVIKLKIIPLPFNISEGEIFWLYLHSYLMQALDILFMCLEYKLVPYIKSRVTLRYINLCSDIMNNANLPELSDMLFKYLIANIIYNTFDEEKVKMLNFMNYGSFIQKHNFEDKVFNILKSENIYFENFSYFKSREIIEQVLKNMYSELEQIH